MRQRQQERIQEGLITDGIFPAELAGYAGSAAAAELLYHWEAGGEPLDAAVKRADVQDVIRLLQTWAREL